MMNQLQAAGLGIVGLAVIAIIGITVTKKLGTAANETTQSDYIVTQLGSSGLTGWIPAVIAVVIGGLFLMYFGGKKTY
jgi:hypothetical protein